MKYPLHWNGRVKISNHEEYGRVTVDGNRIGRVRSRHSPGATTPKGMQTDVVWEAYPAQADKLPDQPTQTLAVEAMIKVAGIVL